MDIYVKKKQITLIYQTKIVHPKRIILNRREIERDPELVESYLKTQTQVIGHFDDVSRK